MLTNYKSHNIETVRICINIEKSLDDKLIDELMKDFSLSKSSLIDKIIKEYFAAKEKEGIMSLLFLFALKLKNLCSRIEI